jgi:hypothetical protein
VLSTDATVGSKPPNPDAGRLGKMRSINGALGSARPTLV